MFAPEEHKDVPVMTDIIQGRVEKTGSPPNGDGNPDGGGDGGSVWSGIAGVLVAVAKTTLQVIASIAQAKAIEAQNPEKSGYGKPVNISHSQIDSSPEIQQYKSHISNLINTSKISLSQEYDKMQKMIEEVSAMPKGFEKDSKWQKVLSKGAELDKVNSIINNIETYNNHDMPEKIVKEVNKLSDSLPQNYVKSLQPLSSSPSPHTFGMTASVQNYNSVAQSYPTYPQAYNHANMAEFINRANFSPAEKELYKYLNELYSDPYIFLPEIPIGKYAGQLLGKQPFIKGILKKLSEKDILREIDKICAENKSLDKDRFINYYELLKQYGLSPTLHGIERIEERTRTIKNLSFEKIMDTIISGEKWIDPKGNLTMIKDRITVHFNKQGEIITVIYREKFNPIKKGFKKWLKIENIGEKNAN